VSKEFTLPDVGEGIESGTVVAVLVAEGDRIEVDQSVLELETDKAVVEVPSTVSGVVRKVHVDANSEAKVGQVILTVEEAGAAPAPKAEPAEPEAEADGPDVEPESEAPEPESGEPEPAPVREPAPEPRGAEDRGAPAARGTPAGLVPAAPSVRRLAREQGIDIADVPGSGILGRISADDVRRFVETGAAAPAAAAAPAPVKLPDFSAYGSTERVGMSNVRKVTVRTMTTSWTTVPMVTHFDKADATDFEGLRQRYKGAVESEGAKLTPTAMLVKVVAAALRRFPDFNASIDTAVNEIVYKHFVNVGVAVDTERGLLVPVIKHADRKNVIELARELGELAEKARDRKLGPDDLSGGSFTVSNLGGIGGTGFTPIVNPPEVAILGVARSALEPVWDDEREEFAARLMMPMALTYDHRLIDGAAAARFLRWVCRAVEEPFLLALEG
jgi:pyruvate dehydrogenase E2 component (dihydrolipoamide acetyltransferase)